MSLAPDSGIFATAATGVQQPYTANAVRLDGNVYATRGGALTGIADGPRLLTTGWCRVTGGAGTARRIFTIHGTSFQSRLIVHLTTDNTFRIEGRNSSNVKIFQVIGPTITNAAWHFFGVSIDLASEANRAMAFDGSIISPTWETYANESMDLSPTSPDCVVGGYQPSGSTQRWLGDLADFQLWTPGAWVDLSAGLSNFIAGGRPVNPSIAASAYGTPLVLLSGPTETWFTNDGSGGGFTPAGTSSLANGQTPVTL